MNLVLFTHPEFLGLQSQQRFARMLAEGFDARGHSVQLRQPLPRARKLFRSGGAAKWAGYVDQYLVFPQEIRLHRPKDPADTLYVFCDQALGPWIPLLSHRPHVVHCHDLLALRSAMGLVPENPTSPTGRLYQRYIRAGFRHARHFVSISEKTRADLHALGGVRPDLSEVVYNGLSHPYRPMPEAQARQVLLEHGLQPPSGRLLLHVGGGQWYKNLRGVLHLFAAYVTCCRAAGREPLPLWLVSPSPQGELRRLVDGLPLGTQVRFLRDVDNDALQALYALADAMLFPSLAEGFGWPIAEALACGCTVLTTDEAPMNEVGGEVAHYLPRLAQASALDEWARHSAQRLLTLLDRPVAERAAAAKACIDWARRFDSAQAIDAYLKIYQHVLTQWQPGLATARHAT